MLTKTQKTTLIKVCKVLFPKYKYVTIDLFHRIVTFSNWKYFPLTFFMPKWRVTLTELVNYQIPSQMADFKYNNRTFISEIQRDLVKCDLTGEDRINYFYNEIASIKYADLYKKLDITPADVKLTPVKTIDDELFEDMVEMFERKQRRQHSQLLGITLNYEILFYLSLLGILAFILFSSIRI